MPLLCRLFGHHRSRIHAVFDDDAQTWKSWCNRCGTPLIREESGRWREHEAPQGGS
jgi:hypothetical protein